MAELQVLFSKTYVLPNKPNCYFRESLLGLSMYTVEIYNKLMRSV